MSVVVSGLHPRCLRRRNKVTHIIGVNVSDKNIWYANKTVRLPNVQVHALDVVRHVGQPTPLPEGKSSRYVHAWRRPGAYLGRRSAPLLFRSMAALGGPAVKVLITVCQNEFYQRYLMAEQPDELQIIDNIITPSYSSRKAGGGFALTYFRVIAMWNLPDTCITCLNRRSSCEEDEASVPAARANALLQF